MNWLGLFNKIGKQPIKNTQNQKVYALIKNEKTGEYEKKYLALKFNNKFLDWNKFFARSPLPLRSDSLVGRG